MKVQVITDNANVNTPQWHVYLGRNAKYQYADGEQRVEQLVLPASRALQTLAAEKMPELAQLQATCSCGEPKDAGVHVPDAEGGHAFVGKIPAVTDENAYFRALYVVTVKDWRGIFGVGSSEVLPCTDVTKAFVFECQPSLAGSAIDGSTQNGTGILEDDQKN